MSFRRNGVGTGFSIADAILPKGHVHLVGLPRCSDRKPLKLLDLEFANSIDSA